ncbi:hypothetical protein SAMN02745121_07341 [Nannocystis exedens]|uniref:Uncharacterized protein n=1 Tax=Nannocystis exedens TaxID=54 RepID=A0A1I2GKT3_9BACT|nr:hypothetical protein [Nannocystis exedens]PCC73593.1 hypothetical protein NAEX_06681 [Nannocystis exedens]SFF17590.1 hypothetical protein SAMN02745121_07341 [Nannocystis exedens]
MDDKKRGPVFLARPHRLGPGACAALVAALSAAPVMASPAAAEAPSRLALTWSAPPGCPQLDEFRAWLSGHLGAAADPAGYPGLTTQGALEREGAGWRLRLVIARDGTRGEKTLRGRHCEELARSGALALAIAIEPGLAGAGAEAEAGPEPESGQVPAPPEPGQVPGPAEPGQVPAPPEPGSASGQARGPIPEPAAEPAGENAPGVGEIEPPPASAGPLTPPRPRVAVGHALRLAVGLEAGALPGVGAGLLGGYALRLPGVRLELTANWWPGRRREYAEPAGVGARAQVGAAGLRVCPTPRLRRGGPTGAGRVELPLCAGIELGVLVARGSGFAGARTVRTLWAAAELEPAAVWRFTRRMALWGSAALVVPITRESFAVDPLPELFVIGAAGFRAAVGLEVHLGREKN